MKCPIHNTDMHDMYGYHCCDKCDNEGMIGGLHIIMGLIVAVLALLPLTMR